MNAIERLVMAVHVSTHDLEQKFRYEQADVPDGSDGAMLKQYLLLGPGSVQRVAEVYAVADVAYVIAGLCEHPHLQV